MANRGQALGAHSGHDDSIGMPTQMLAKRLLNIGKHAVARSLWKIRREVTSGAAGRVVPTSAGKAFDDPTKLVDRMTENVLLEYLQDQLREALKLPYIVSTEEEGVIKFLSFGDLAQIDLVVFIDPVDFTESVVRGLDGSSLVTFYSVRQQQILAAVVGDVREHKIYFASEHLDHAFAQFVEYEVPPENACLDRLSSDDQFHFSGDFEQLRPSKLEQLGQAHLNCLVNKPERMEALFRRRRLGEQMQPDGRFYIVGGSLGLVRVAAGIVDGAVEFAKGFREWDAWPGIYICQKAGAFVSDLAGKPIPCRLDAAAENIKVRLEAPNRQKFIATGNGVLGRRLLKLRLEREDE